MGPILDGWVSIHSAANMWLHPYGNSEADSDACERSADHDHQVSCLFLKLKMNILKMVTKMVTKIF